MSDTSFTDDEKAYLNSRGEDTDALERAYKATEAGGGDPAAAQHEGADGPQGAGAGKDARGASEDDKRSKEPGGNDAEDDDDANPPEHVPHGRYHNERERRRAAENERDDLRLKMVRAEERLALLNELMAPGEGGDGTTKGGNGKGGGKAKSAAEEDDIDPLEDFAGAIDQLRRRQKEFFEQVNADGKKREEADGERALSQRYMHDVMARQAKDPSFKDAYAHLMKAFHRELEAWGMTDVSARNKHIEAEEKKLARRAFEANTSPAEMIVKLAETRGYKKPDPKKEDGNPDLNKADNAADNGGDQPKKAPETAADSLKEKLNAIERGQKQAGTLSNAGGTAKSPLTMESILGMSDDEFYERVHKLPLSQRRKILAG